MAGRQVLADRYVVDGRIGQGGGSLVYRAFDRGLRQWIAIKVLDPRRWAASPEPLFRELRHPRELSHPRNVGRGPGQGLGTLEPS